MSSATDLLRITRDSASLVSALGTVLTPIEAQALVLERLSTPIDIAILLGITEQEVAHHTANAKAKVNRLSADDVRLLLESASLDLDDVLIRTRLDTAIDRVRALVTSSPRLVTLPFDADDPLELLAGVVQRCDLDRMSADDQAADRVSTRISSIDDQALVRLIRLRWDAGYQRALRSTQSKYVKAWLTAHPDADVDLAEWLQEKREAAKTKAQAKVFAQGQRLIAKYGEAIAEEGRMSPAIWLKYWEPQMPLCSDDFDKGSYRKPREIAIQRREIQTRTTGTPNCIVLDLDHSNTVEHIAMLVARKVIPEPNLITVRKSNGHGHAVYFIDGFALSPKQRATLYSIAGRLTYLMKADTGYSGLLTHNPLHPDFAPVWGTSHRYSFAELREYSDKAPNITRRRVKAQIAAAQAEGRNTTLKVLLTAWAASKRSMFFGRDDAFYDAILEEAHRLNTDNLPDSEIRSLAKSRWNYARRLSEDAHLEWVANADHSSEAQQRRSLQAPHVVKGQQRAMRAFNLRRRSTLKPHELASHLGFRDTRAMNREMRKVEGWSWNHQRAALYGGFMPSDWS